MALPGLLSLSAHCGDRPIVPPTVIGDAGGALGLAFGMACVLFEARISGRGQVVDAVIVDVVAMLGSIAQWVRGNGQLDGPRPSPFHDSPFCDVYACADGSFITLGAMEPQFYALLLDKLGLVDVNPEAQYDVTELPLLKLRLTVIFASQPRARRCEPLEGSDVCFAPVLSVAEAAAHPQNVEQGTYCASDGGGLQVAAAPRLLSPKAELTDSVAAPRRTARIAVFRHAIGAK